jgi:hypothetical protein
LGYRPAVEGAARIFRQAAIGTQLALADHMDMPEPRVKRYALVPNAGPDGVRRFHLARVATAPRPRPGAERLQRMEEIAARDRPPDVEPTDSGERRA